MNRWGLARCGWVTASFRWVPAPTQSGRTDSRPRAAGRLLSEQVIDQPDNAAHSACATIL